MVEYTDLKVNMIRFFFFLLEFSGFHLQFTGSCDIPGVGNSNITRVNHGQRSRPPQAKVMPIPK